MGILDLSIQSPVLPKPSARGVTGLYKDSSRAQNVDAESCPPLTWLHYP